ncbi:MAG: ABC transporter permease, partial [Solirubrobacteraceae bacterium]
MGRFIVRRIIAMILVMFIVSVLTFVMLVKIPGGDPAQRLAGRSATQAEVHQIEAKYGFNKPIYTQYANTMKNIFTGQAYSYTQGFNVLDEIKQGLPVTLSLALGAGIFWLLASILVGTLAAIKAGKFVDRLLTVLAMFGVSFPPFFLGAVLLYFLGYKAGIFPLGGYVKFTDSPWQWFVHLILPWFTLSVLFI